MAQKKYQNGDDPEIAIIEKANRKGALNVVGDILSDPEVQGMIKGALLKETVKNSITMACILVGILKIYDVAKILIGFNWVGDLIIASILLAIGLIYLFQTMFSLKKNGHSETDRGNTNAQ